MGDATDSKEAINAWSVVFMPGEPGGMESSIKLIEYMESLGKRADTAKVFLGANEHGKPAICVVSRQ